MKTNFATIIALLYCCTASGADDEFSFTEIETVLHEKYPDYTEIIGPSRQEEVAARTTPEDLSKDILVGDFNSDDVLDFVAKLARPLQPEELAQVRPPHRGRLTTAEIVVVCDGHLSESAQTAYRCYELMTAQIGPIFYELAYQSWRENEVRFEEGDQLGCQTEMQSRNGLKSLSLVQPYGHCDVFYYPRKNGGYEGCWFCAD